MKSLSPWMAKARHHSLSVSLFLTRRAPWIVAALLLIVAVVEAEARVGGGRGYSGGGGFRSSGSSRSYSGSHGGGSGDGGLALYFLFRFAIEHPFVALCLIAMGTAYWMFIGRHQLQERSHTIVEGHTGGAPAVRHASLPSTWERLAKRDTGLSEPVLLDFVQLVVRRAWGAAAGSQWEALRPFVSPEVQARLTAAVQGADGLQDVVLASAVITQVDLGRETDTLRVDVVHGHTLVRNGKTYPTHVESSWTFSRSAHAVSLPPDAVHRMGCPSCGAAVQCDPMGACTNCGTSITRGQLQWQATDVQIVDTRPMAPPPLRGFGETEEPSYTWPTVVDPQLPAQLRSYRGRHPQFDVTQWETRIHHTFLELQRAWGANAWDAARPFCTDNAWNTLRFWIDRYQRAGLVNRVEDTRILKMQVVSVDIDAWYESITVRFWAEMRDWTEDAQGKIVDGNKRTPHRFSEYWTFVRAVGTGATSKDPSSCPSCGAPLDRINAAGTCGYCDSVITLGTYDWVLSRIDQCEAYRG